MASQERIMPRQAFRAVFRFLSSVKLAVILLAVLIVATAIGTIYESRFDAKVARAYVYEAPWFSIWLILLVTNLACAAFSRYPWKRHHAGFVITHAGIITLLAGAVVGRVWGIEGTMTLFVGNEPSNRLVVDRPEVKIGEGANAEEFPVGVKYRHASAATPQFLGTTKDGWKVNMTDYAELLEAVPTPQEVADGGDPTIQVHLWNGGMTQEVVQWLWPKDPENRLVDLGMLAIEARLGTPPVAHASTTPASPVQLVSTGAAANANTPPAFPPGDRAIIYVGDDGKLSYYIQNKSGAVIQGAIDVGKPVATGWGDWKIEVTRIFKQAVPFTDFKPVAKDAKLPPRERANCSEGVKVQVSRGDEHYEEWLATGWQVDLPTPQGAIQASFGPHIAELPITLELKHFAVERQEGNDSPAGFASTVQVRDASGDTATGSCSMNEPMEYPYAFWRELTGLTYKISQASWNPQNLDQSSVQILLDPGWLFKWIGSLMICIGIFTMFYLRPPRSMHP